MKVLSAGKAAGQWLEGERTQDNFFTFQGHFTFPIRIQVTSSFNETVEDTLGHINMDFAQQGYQAAQFLSCNNKGNLQQTTTSPASSSSSSSSTPASSSPPAAPVPSPLPPHIPSSTAAAASPPSSSAASTELPPHSHIISNETKVTRTVEGKRTIITVCNIITTEE